MIPKHEPRADCKNTHSLDQGSSRLKTFLLESVTILLNGYSCFSLFGIKASLDRKVMKSRFQSPKSCLRTTWKTLLARESSGTQTNEILLLIECAI